MENILKQKAIILRRQGYSFREIGLVLEIPRSTIRMWASREPLDEAARLRLKDLGDKGRQRAKETNRRKQELILKEINKDCGVLMNKRYGRDEYKLFLALLYWGEGAKTGGRLIFINSDPEMIKLYLWLLRKSFIIREERLKCLLHLHEYHNQGETVDFWSKVTGIPKNNFSIYNKPHTGINKKPGYKGCLSIRYGDSRIIKEIFIIIERLENLANIAGLV